MKTLALITILFFAAMLLALPTDTVPASAPAPSPTAEIGSLPETKFPTPGERIPTNYDVTNLPCTHFATNKGKASWPGTKEKPWPLNALFGAKRSFLKSWSVKNGRRPHVCGEQDWLR